MEVATLTLNTDGVARTSAGLVHARLRIDVGNKKFPDPNWTDFAVVVLSWWCKGLTRLVTEEDTSVEIRFMDGPFLARVDAREKTSWELCLIRRLRTDRIEYLGEIDSGPLLDSVVTSAETVILLCKDRGWISRDTEDLERSLSELKYIRGI